MWFTLCKFLTRKHESSHNTCPVQVGMREPGNHDNGASDVWALTAYCIDILPGNQTLKCGFHGARERFAKDANI